jgi:hypothetical protein
MSDPIHKVYVRTDSMVFMCMTAWLSQLNKRGIKDALQHPKGMMRFYIAFVIIRWVAIAPAIAVAAYLADDFRYR